MGSCSAATDREPDLLVIGGEDVGTEPEERLHLFLLWDKANGWTRPFAKKSVYTRGPQSIAPVEVLWEPEIGIICAVFRVDGQLPWPAYQLVFSIPPWFVAGFMNEVRYEHYRAGRYQAAEYGFRLAAEYEPSFEKAL